MQTLERTETVIERTLSPKLTKGIVSALRKAQDRWARVYPGETGDRQAVHTVYGGAHLFKAEAAGKLGNLALKTLAQYAPNPELLANILGLGKASLAQVVYTRVVEKLKREPIEDFRIDFEDGYGNRPDAEEDGHAQSSAEELAKGLSMGVLPPFMGIRIKPFSKELHERSIRTLDIFLSTLASKTRGRLPSGFVVTIPKITMPEQVEALAKLMAVLETKRKFPKNSLKIELMIETPQAIIDQSGQASLRNLVEAGGGRCASVHFGTYDYTALCGITASNQSMTHQACDFAKNVMQVSLAQSGVMLSDGATNVMPVPVHRASPDGPALTEQQLRENQEAIERAWKLHFDQIRHSLETGYYQGWDLHPAQLVTRYAAVYSFFLEGLEEATARLKNFIDKAAQATLIGDVFDDAATGQGLLNYFLRALNCGAITLAEAQATGLTQEEFRTRSFLKILEGRKKSTPTRG